jgi:hypothetical protein
MMDAVSPREEKRRWLWREGQGVIFFVFMCLLALVFTFVALDGWEIVQTLALDNAPSSNQQVLPKSE